MSVEDMTHVLEVCWSHVFIQRMVCKIDFSFSTRDTQRCWCGHGSCHSAHRTWSPAQPETPFQQFEYGRASVLSEDAWQIRHDLFPKNSGIKEHISALLRGLTALTSNLQWLASACPGRSYVRDELFPSYFILKGSASTYVSPCRNLYRWYTGELNKCASLHL